MTNSFDSFLSLFVVVFLSAFFALSLTMAAAVNMRNALQRCGFNLATSDFIMEQGYDSPEELLNVSEDDLDLMIRSASRHPPPDVTFPSLPFPFESSTFLGSGRTKGFVRAFQPDLTCSLNTS